MDTKHATSNSRILTFGVKTLLPVHKLDRIVWEFSHVTWGEDLTEVAFDSQDEIVSSVCSVSLEVQIFDADRRGSAAGAPASVTLAPGQWTQLLNPLADRSVRNGWATIARTTGSAPWVAYGVINDGGAPGQRTGDGAFFLMTVP